MPIRNVSNSNLSAKPPGEAGKTEPAASVAKNRKTGGPAPAPDQVRIESRAFSDDHSYAKNALTRTHEKQIGSLVQIRNKINRGFYDTEQVIEKTGAGIGRDLKAAESPGKIDGGMEKAPGISPGKVRFLTEDSEVAATVAGKIKKDLDNL